ETNAATQVNAQGNFTATATITTLLSAGRPYTATVDEYNAQTGGSPIIGATATNYLFASTPGYNASTVEIYHSGVPPGSSDSNQAGATEYFIAFEFPANVAITLTVGPLSVLQFTTNQYGGYSGSFLVPETLPYSSSGYVVTGINSAFGIGAQTNSTLTIKPSISVSMLTPGVSYIPKGFLEGETGASSFNITGYAFSPGLQVVLGTSATSGEAVVSLPPSLSGDFYIAPNQYTSLNGSFNVTVYIALGYTGFVNNAPTPVTVYNYPSGSNTKQCILPVCIPYHQRNQHIKKSTFCPILINKPSVHNSDDRCWG
ncbi:MAG: hypothetical protein QXU98_12160, partial [Candidatus Parvarchaeota archaeon]